MQRDAPSTPRHHRQLILPQVGEEGQRRLRESHALIVGVGALGCVAADLLCRAGVGAITLVDRDFVEITNLQRQVLFTEADAREGLPKAEAARRRLEAIDSAVRVRAIVDDFNHTNAERSLDAHGADLPPVGVIVDGTDNFETRYLLNDLAVKRGVPYIYAGVVGVSGMQMTILPRAAGGAPAQAWSGHETPCLRCLFPEAPPAGSTPTCDTAGVLGPAVAIVAATEATETIKTLMGAWGAVRRSLLSIDAWTGQTHQLALDDATGAADCPCCSGRVFEHLEGRSASRTTSLCGRNSVQILPGGSDNAPARMDLRALAERLRAHGEFTSNEHMLRGAFSNEQSAAGAPIELALFTDGRAIIKNTDSIEAARAIYAKYVGV
ncbi:MAG: thiazole biosynthesis adenylyltransferase ThiF [Phycisphaeraceae bacterium]|nr:MAG: thiazole biosynthesis adenylyltransferase ThiF [Phycisphaeraceae bacterium]